MAEGPKDGSIPGVPAAGEIVAGKYRVGRVLGMGGMGVVVAAEHVELGQALAMKFLHPDVAAQADTAKRFLREARAVVPISGEHVAKVHDVGTLENGAPYMVMERLVGRDLGAALSADGPLGIETAVDYVLQASEALAEAHARGIVHRDLKPSNLFLTKRADGSPMVKVLDFGVAKAVRGELDVRTITAEGQVVGSPQYMSPEQIRGAVDVDRRADVWALGVVLYRLVTDELPFDEDVITALSAAIASDPPRPLRDHLPDVPPDFESAVLRCLEKKPDDRYSDLAELARALGPVASTDARRSIERIERIVRASSTASESARPDVPDRSAIGLVATEDYPRPAADGAQAEAEPKLASANATTMLESGRDETRSAWDTPVTSAKRWPIVAVLGGGLAAAAAITFFLWPPTPPRLRRAAPAVPAASGAWISRAPPAVSVVTETPSPRSSVDRQGADAGVVPPSRPPTSKKRRPPRMPRASAKGRAPADAAKKTGVDPYGDRK